MGTVPLHGYRPAPGAATVTSSPQTQHHSPLPAVAPRHPGTFPRAPSPPGGLSVKTSSWRRAAGRLLGGLALGSCSMQAGVAAHLGPCRSLGHLPAQLFGLQRLQAGPRSLRHRCCPTQSRNKAGHRALGSERPRQPGALQGAAHCLAPAVLMSEACAGWRSSWRGRSFSPHLAEFPVGTH